MFKGEVCKFYELSDNIQDDCLYGTAAQPGYDVEPAFFIEKSGFRYPAFVLSLVAPVFFSIVELSLN